MDFKRDELLGIFISIVVAVVFFAGIRFDIFSSITNMNKEREPEVSTVVLPEATDAGGTIRALTSAMTARGEITKLIVEDSVVGVGTEVKMGSRVTVHYVGMLQSGEQFDSSITRGEPFSFTVGVGDVIKGWDAGLIGMKVGGERILVIPPELGYGSRAVGKIPADSVLLFSIELIAIE